MRDVFLSRLVELAQHDSKILLVTGDLGFKVLDPFRERFPDRFLNAGIAEQNMTGLAAGLALEGWTVFVYSIANFPSLRCFEQIRNDIVYHNANVKLLSIGAGFSYGQLGMSHHGTEDVTIMRTLPGMSILSPCDDWEMDRCAEFITAEKGPFYLRVDKASAGTDPKGNQPFIPGKLRMICNGEDVSIIATGSILKEAVKAHDVLRQKGISCRVYACHSLKPFDEASLFQAVLETGGIVTLEEHTIEGGLGGIVAERLFDGGTIPRFFIRMGLKDQFVKVVGSQEFLRKEYGLNSDSVAYEVAKMVAAHKNATRKA